MIGDYTTLFDDLGRQIGQLVKDALKIEFERQGHKLTGGLINSIDYRVNARTNGAQIEFLMFDYGLAQNNGVSAAKIPFSPGSGAKTSKYIEGLKAFARLRFGANDMEAQRIAFAIAYKHKKEGMPTANSYRYSSNGRRTGAIEAVLDETEQEIERLISAALSEIITADFVKAFATI